jgi:PIN domain nuclease of toxin-antitoxin system
MGHGSVIVLDTHALVWWVAGAPELSARARRAIDAAVRRDAVVASTISILEIVTAVRRGRLTLSVTSAQWLADIRLLPELHFEPVSADIASCAGAFDASTHGDPADRLILATAATLGTRLISADRRFRGNRHVEVVW